jgi:hypothetical protein
MEEKYFSKLNAKRAQVPIAAKAARFFLRAMSARTRAHLQCNSLPLRESSPARELSQHPRNENCGRDNG